MSDTVIRVESLGKKYIIGHQKRERYTALRDVLADGAKSLGRKLLTPLGKRTPNPAVEEFWALKDVSFEIKQGDCVGIIGRNGAGKSTLLKILSRITEPTSGRISIEGRVASLLEVGTGFHPELTGRENIYLNGAILGMSKVEIKNKFDEIVAFAEVDKFLDTPVKRYSSGMYVRLAFAVAAHLEPEILIVDEVLAVGDINFQKKCLGKIQDVSTKEGRTVLFVSHNMGAVSSLCSKVVYLTRGQVKAIGPVIDIVTEYFLDVSIKETGDLAEWRVPVPDFGKEIRFYEIELLSNNNPGLLFGQQLKYALKIHSDIDINDINIGSSIFDVSGTCIGSFITASFSIQADQRLVLYLDVPNLNLAPGSYHAGFSIGHGGKDSPRRDLDGIVGKPCFQILPFSRTDEQAANWNPKWGWVVFRDVKLSIAEAQICS